MPIMSKRWPEYPATRRELLAMLGVENNRLPAGPQRWNVQGYEVSLITSEEAKAAKPQVRKPHRLCVRCALCKTYVSAGRLSQHEAACG